MVPIPRKPALKRNMSSVPHATSCHLVPSRGGGWIFGGRCCVTHRPGPRRDGSVSRSRPPTATRDTKTMKREQNNLWVSLKIRMHNRGLSGRLRPGRRRHADCIKNGMVSTHHCKYQLVMRTKMSQFKDLHQSRAARKGVQDATLEKHRHTSGNPSISRPPRERGVGTETQIVEALATPRSPLARRDSPLLR
jgi:hypothetical protein